MTHPISFGLRMRQAAQRPLISVHRGLWGPAPENSITAIENSRPYDIVEIDVHLSADEVPFLMHDPTLERMTGRVEACSALTFDAIEKLPLKTGAGGPEAMFSSQCIPSLQAALAAAGPGLYFDIDVKDPREIEAVANSIADSGFRHRCSLKIDTWQAEDIKSLIDLEARFGVTIIAKVVLPKTGITHIGDLASAGVAAAEIWFDDVEQIEAARQLAGTSFGLITYTLNPVHCCSLNDDLALSEPDRVWGALRRAGIDVVMTDQAAELARYLSSTS